MRQQTRGMAPDRLKVKTLNDNPYLYPEICRCPEISNPSHNIFQNSLSYSKTMSKVMKIDTIFQVWYPLICKSMQF